MDNHKPPNGNILQSLKEEITQHLISQNYLTANFMKAFSKNTFAQMVIDALKTALRLSFFS